MGAERGGTVEVTWTWDWATVGFGLAVFWVREDRELVVVVGELTLRVGFPR